MNGCLLLSNAEARLNKATKEIKQANNVLEVIQSYLDGRRAKEDTQKQKIFAEVTISSTLQGDEIMKNITYRKDGRYMARIQINNKMHTVYARTQKQIVSKLNTLKKQISSGDTNKNNYLLYEWTDYWWNHFKQPFVDKKSQIPLYIKNIKENFPNMPLSKINTQQIQLILNKYQRSRKKELVTIYLNAIFQKAVDLGYINLNPCKALVKEQKIKSKKVAFTFDEQVKIIHAIKGTDIEKDIYIYLFTGMRKNEYSPKTIKNNIDIKNNTLTILCEKKRDSKPVYRIVDLSPAMIKYILAPKSGPQYVPQTIYKHFRDILKSLSIKGSLHTLRHTFTTNYFYLGVPDKLRSSWLGHEKVDLTQDIYTNIDRSISKEKLIELYGDKLYLF